jgi:hypothetical protein
LLVHRSPRAGTTVIVVGENLAHRLREDRGLDDDHDEC